MKSWINHNADCDFSIYNIPFGIVDNGSGHFFAATAIGEYCVNLDLLYKSRFFIDLNLPMIDFSK